MIKKVISLLIALSMTFTIMCMNISAVSGDTNVDVGDGSGLGDGSNANGWAITNSSGGLSYSCEGLRVYAVNADTGMLASNVVDFSNTRISPNVYHFNYKTKLEYLSNSTLTHWTGTYISYVPTYSLPSIIPYGAADTAERLTNINNWLTNEAQVRDICSLIGVSYDALTQSGTYKLGVEPIVYLRKGGIDYALTATEAGLLNILTNGEWTRTFGLLTGCNLPVALFLNQREFGIQPYNGATNTYLARNVIVNQLGIGYVTYDLPIIPTDEADLADGTIVDDGSGAYSYPTNTWVITPVTLANMKAGGTWTAADEDITTEAPASVTFSYNRTSKTVTDIVIPKGGTQLVWIKWKTPSSPTSFSMTTSTTNGYFVNPRATAEYNRYASALTLSITIYDHDRENTPPDPTADDKGTDFGYSKTAANNALNVLKRSSGTTSTSWSVWYCKYEIVDSGSGGPARMPTSNIDSYKSTIKSGKSNAVFSFSSTPSGTEWHGPEVGNVSYSTISYTYEEWGYVFYKTIYTALLQTPDVKITPSAYCPTSYSIGSTTYMKSGYGIYVSAGVSIKLTTVNPDTGTSTSTIKTGYTGADNCIGLQTANAYFPEFKYITYYRSLELNSNKFVFRKNVYSAVEDNDNCHYTPIWYPDNTNYQIYVRMTHAFTPAGVLSTGSASNAIYIKGNVFDDWHVAVVGD